MKSLTRRAALVLGCLAAWGGAARAADWPSGPIKLIVPSAPGGGADTIARIFATRLQADLSQTLVMDYKAGAGGLIAAQSIKVSPADGYSVMITNSSILGANEFLFKTLPYDVHGDFDPVALLATVASTAVVSTRRPYKSLAALIQATKAKPGTVSFGYYASSSQIPAEILKIKDGIDIVGIACKNITQITTDLIGDQISFALLDDPSAAGAIAGGLLKPLAVTSRQPGPLWPEAPALATLYPGFEFEAWYGLSVPRGTPRPVIERVAKSIAETQHDPAAREQLQKLGYKVATKSPSEFTAFIRSERERWAAWTKTANLTPQ